MEKQVVHTVGWSLLHKAVLLVAVTGLLFYVLREPKSFVFFTALAFLLSMGRSVPLGAILAVLIGLAIPWLGVALIFTGLVMLVAVPTKSLDPRQPGW